MLGDWGLEQYGGESIPSEQDVREEDAWGAKADKKMQPDYDCDHEYEPTFQGGDTYKCRLCGKEIDMTED